MRILREYKPELLKNQSRPPFSFLKDIPNNRTKDVEIAHHWCDNFVAWNVPHQLIDTGKFIRLMKKDETFTQSESLVYRKRSYGLEVEK